MDRRSPRRPSGQALGSLGAGDCLLIAGKGHEDYQILGKEKKHFSDQEEIAAWMGGPSVELSLGEMAALLDTAVAGKAVPARAGPPRP